MTPDALPQETLDRLYRRVLNVRRDDRRRGTEPPAENVDLELEAIQLREENARLRMARSRRSEIGTAIDELRLVAVECEGDESGDDVWSTIADLLVIREGIAQACLEMELALASVRERLALLPTLDGARATPGPPAQLVPRLESDSRPAA
jgi:hypothetical protein